MSSYTIYSGSLKSIKPGGMADSVPVLCYGIKKPVTGSISATVLAAVLVVVLAAVLAAVLAVPVAELAAYPS